MVAVAVAAAGVDNDAGNKASLPRTISALGSDEEIFCANIVVIPTNHTAVGRSNANQSKITAKTTTTNDDFVARQ